MHYIDYNDRQLLYKYKNKLYRKLKDILINYHNKRYINYECRKPMIVNGFKLDREQKRTIILDEINTLVIAGAGSGKSLTIAGKVNYLVANGISPSDILCISLTNDACDSLKSKLNYDIDVMTFHKLALNLIGYDKYKICSSNYLNYIVDEYFSSVIYNSEDMINLARSIFKDNVTYDNCLKSKEMINIKRIIITFINLYKANDYNLQYFCQIDDQEAHNLLKIIIDIYFLYSRELKSQNMIDFNDMISLATKYILEHKINYHYKYIIIDEFQDTSLVKLNLIKTLADKCGSKTFVVGDDFQSIYRFTGCNLDIFLNYHKYIGYVKRLFITHTYRNSQQLVDVATKFVLKNKYQIQKKIKSNLSRNKPIKIIKYKFGILEVLFEYLINRGEENILLLGRNNNDINKYLSDNIKLKDDYIYYKESSLNIKYLTVHRSKGLEEECVIVLNLFDDVLGFPCQIKNDKLLDIINGKDKYPYEEERRLFYVCLTRTKKDIYLICPLKLSIFVKELMIYSKKYMEHLDL